MERGLTRMQRINADFFSYFASHEKNINQGKTDLVFCNTECYLHFNCQSFFNI
jgi:hypothetical protein